MTIDEFIAKYFNYESVSLADLIKDFGLRRDAASKRLYDLKNSGVIVLLTEHGSLGNRGSIPATYKMNPSYAKKQSKAKAALKEKPAAKTKPTPRNYAQEISIAMKDTVAFTISDICNVIGGHNSTIKDALMLMVSNGTAYCIGQRQAAANNIRPLYSLLKPKQNGVDFLISKMIGGTVVNHPKGTVHKGDQRHPSDDCIKVNNGCGGASILHTGYAASSTRTGATRYD